MPSGCTHSAVSILRDAFSADASALGAWTLTVSLIVSGVGTIISALGTEPASVKVQGCILLSEWE